MERVKTGEKYWYLYLWGATPRVTLDKEGLNPPLDAERFAYGNYFNTEEEAESMAEKISKVLKGADVIEMPSEYEIHEIAELDEISYVMYNSHKPKSYDEWFRIGFKRGINWLKSKTIK